MQNTSGPTLGEIVALNPAAARVLDRLELDYCCHGQRTLAEACTAAGLDPAGVTRELEELPLDGDTSWTGLGPAALADHIVATHHRYLEDELPLLDALAAKVFTVHGDRHPELEEVWAVLDALRIELTSHLRDEEELLFPAVHGWSAGQREFPFGSLAGLVRLMLADHDRAGDLLAELRRATNAFAVPDDACASYRSLYERLEALELDTHLHVHKENHALFPAVLEIAAE